MESDESHVVIERQPGCAAICFRYIDCVACDTARIREQRSMRYSDAGRRPGAAGGELQVTHIVRFDRGQVCIGFRHLFQVLDCSNQLDVQTHRRLADRLEEDSRGDHRAGLCGRHHGANVVDIVDPSCECRGRG